jgi:hypothetical protein
MIAWHDKQRTAEGKSSLRVVVACSLLFAVIGGACAEDDSGATVDIAANIPWTAPEAHRYIIVNGENEEQGQGVLSVAEDRDGNVVFVQQFSDEDGNSDRSVVVAQPGTLRPIRSEREIVDADDDRRAVAVSRYSQPGEPDPIVRIAELNYDPADEDDPSLRCSPLEIDSPHYYDNDTSLLLWRSIRFEEGWSGTYTNVLSNRRTQRALTVRVRRQEEIETPAGTFEAWLIGIEGEGRETQSAWFATTPDHRLLAYNNREDQVFLYAGEAEPIEIEPEELEPLPEECEENDD